MSSYKLGDVFLLKEECWLDTGKYLQVTEGIEKPFYIYGELRNPDCKLLKEDHIPINWINRKLTSEEFENYDNKVLVQKI